MSFCLVPKDDRGKTVYEVRLMQPKRESHGPREPMCNYSQGRAPLRSREPLPRRVSHPINRPDEFKCTARRNVGDNLGYSYPRESVDRRLRFDRAVRFDRLYDDKVKRAKAWRDIKIRDLSYDNYRHKGHYSDTSHNSSLTSDSEKFFTRKHRRSSRRRYYYNRRHRGKHSRRRSISSSPRRGREYSDSSESSEAYHIRKRKHTRRQRTVPSYSSRYYEKLSGAPDPQDVVFLPVKRKNREISENVSVAATTTTLELQINIIRPAQRTSSKPLVPRSSNIQGWSCRPPSNPCKPIRRKRDATRPRTEFIKPNTLQNNPSSKQMIPVEYQNGRRKVVRNAKTQPPRDVSSSTYHLETPESKSPLLTLPAPYTLMRTESSGLFISKGREKGFQAISNLKRMPSELNSMNEILLTCENMEAAGHGRTERYFDVSKASRQMNPNTIVQALDPASTAEQDGLRIGDHCDELSSSTEGTVWSLLEGTSDSHETVRKSSPSSSSVNYSRSPNFEANARLMDEAKEKNIPTGKKRRPVPNWTIESSEWGRVDCVEPEGQEMESSGDDHKGNLVRNGSAEDLSGQEDNRVEKFGTDSRPSILTTNLLIDSLAERQPEASLPSTSNVIVPGQSEAHNDVIPARSQEENLTGTLPPQSRVAWTEIEGNGSSPSSSVHHSRSPNSEANTKLRDEFKEDDIPIPNLTVARLQNERAEFNEPEGKREIEKSKPDAVPGEVAEDDVIPLELMYNVSWIAESSYPKMRARDSQEECPTAEYQNPTTNDCELDIPSRPSEEGTEDNWEPLNKSLCRESVPRGNGADNIGRSDHENEHNVRNIMSNNGNALVNKEDSFKAYKQIGDASDGRQALKYSDLSSICRETYRKKDSNGSVTIYMEGPSYSRSQKRTNRMPTQNGGKKRPGADPAHLMPSLRHHPRNINA